MGIYSGKMFCTACKAFIVAPEPCFQADFFQLMSHNLGVVIILQGRKGEHIFANGFVDTEMQQCYNEFGYKFN